MTLGYYLKKFTEENPYSFRRWVAWLYYMDIRDGHRLGHYMAKAAIGRTVVDGVTVEPDTWYPDAWRKAFKFMTDSGKVLDFEQRV